MDDAMIVVRFQVRCKPDKTEQALAALRKVIAPSRALDGVISFDIAQDLADPDTIVATEVFADQSVLERQESLPEVQEAMGLFDEFLAAEPEATIFHVSSAEPWGG